ncbi:MAG: nucleotidyltransferase family protein [Nitrospiraceae bacterium]|nr:MAG: nucleotidyltransferase family protein [Nitrospiraceae bacterium]
MRDIEELKKILDNHKSSLESEYMIKEIGIFGSYIKHEEEEDSDIDILVDFGRESISLRLFILKNYLSELLRVNIDLVMKKALKPNSVNEF